MHIRNWTARPAGGRISIRGEDVDTGEPATLTGVTAMTPAVDVQSRFFGLLQIAEPYIVATVPGAGAAPAVHHKLIID